MQVAKCGKKIEMRQRSKTVTTVKNSENPGKWKGLEVSRSPEKSKSRKVRKVPKSNPKNEKSKSDQKNEKSKVPKSPEKSKNDQKNEKSKSPEK